MLRKRRALEVSAAPSFEAGDWVLMHSLDNTRVWRGTIMPANEKTQPGHYRVFWDDDFVSSSIPADLLETTRGDGRN
jgi:hypothetical protein